MPSAADILLSATRIRIMCENLKLDVVTLQPLQCYEGHSNRIRFYRMNKTLRSRIRIAEALGTNTIVVTANHLPANQLWQDFIVQDLRQLAVYASNRFPPMQIAYSATCYSTHIDTWEKAWEIVKQVNMPNFGICLNTFHIATSVWGGHQTPYSPSIEAYHTMNKLIEDMLKVIDPKKVFLLQVSDAESFQSPIDENHPWFDPNEPNATALRCWSQNARTFPFEPHHGGSLPVESLAVALIVQLKYEGFVSMEVFSQSTRGASPRVPAEHALRGILAWRQLDGVVASNRSTLEDSEQP